MNDTPRLFLLDAYALIFRAYYALIRMPRITSSGFNTSAIFGFVNTLEELLRRENPTHIAVCFDPPGPTFRHEAFADYKGERDATPEDIKLSIPYIKKIIEAYNIPILEVPGFEADDVIGTMALRAAAEGFTTYMMTPDKDFGQLVGPGVYQYKPAYKGGEFEVRGVSEVCERYGLESPAQVIDLLALMGDKVDNIPGCPGVGEKTAEKLIRQFGSVDNLIASTNQLKGALRKKVEENSEQILFSKYLATIRTDVPLEVTPASLERCTPDLDRLLEIFGELEFRTLITRIKKRLTPETEPLRAVQGSLFDETPAPAAPVAVLPVGEPEVRVADSADELARLRTLIDAAGSLAIFTMAEGGADMTANTLGWALALPDHNNTAWWLPASEPAARWVADRYTSPKLLKLSSAVKRDCVCLHNLCGMDVGGVCNYVDVTVAHYILLPDMSHSLEIMASTDITDYKLLSDKKMGALTRLPAGRLSSLAARCALTVLSLHAPLMAEIDVKGLTPLLTDIELPLITVLAQMEITGVQIDVEALHAASLTLSARLNDIEREVYDLAGEEFNIGSPARVGEIIFDKMQLSAKPKKTKTGQYSTSEEELEKVAHLSPIVGKILEYRQLKKLLSTYINALPNTINKTTGRIHTTYNQTVTATGRLSSSDPNLQNIPVREAVGREIRRAFIPSPGNIFLSADYSQIELRLVADFAADEDMIEAFSLGRDIHATTAAKIFHTTVEAVTDEQRRKAKTANFGILYGISAFGLSQRLGIPRYEAKELIDNYFDKFPTIRGYIDRMVAEAREKGYVSTAFGRRRPLPDINSRNATVRGYAERNAVNAPIQGSAADIIKIAMVRIAAEMRSAGMASTMIMQVHDELDFDVVPAELPRLREIVVRCMEDAYRGRVCLTASVGQGANWLEAH